MFHVNDLEERSVHWLLLKLARLMNLSLVLPSHSPLFSSTRSSTICARDFSLGLNSTLTWFFLLSFLRCDSTHSRFWTGKMHPATVCLRDFIAKFYFVYFISLNDTAHDRNRFFQSLRIDLVLQIDIFYCRIS